MTRRRIALFLIFQAIVTAASAAEKPVRIAVISNLAEPVVQEGLALAESLLTTTKDIRLIERQQISAVLTEHHLTLGGIADAATAVKVGKLVTADLFAVVSGNPAAKNREVLSVVVFNARTGARLVDRAAGQSCKVVGRSVRRGDSRGGEAPSRRKRDEDHKRRRRPQHRPGPGA